MIFDCFLYNGEKSLLKIRAEEFLLLEPLKKYMPYRHVAIESRYTFTGIERKFSMTPEDIERYNIEWFPINDTPYSDPWKNEQRQRNYIKDALIGLGVQDNDTVIISDVDEIPKTYAIQHYRPDMGLAALQMDVYCYYLNSLASRQDWRHPKIMPWSYLKDKTPEEVRNGGFNLAMVNAGWHMTYMGGIDVMLEKFKSFSHQEESVQKFANADVLRTMRHNRTSIWGKDLELAPDGDLPYYVRTNKEEFKSMLCS